MLICMCLSACVDYNADEGEKKLSEPLGSELKVQRTELDLGSFVRAVSAEFFFQLQSEPSDQEDGRWV